MEDPETNMASPSPPAEDPGLQAAMELPITVSLGPMGPLLRKLDSIGPEQFPPDEIRHLKVLCISLKDLSEDVEASITSRWWMKIVRELCYDTEDHLDEFVVAGGAHLDFSELVSRAKDASERRQRFQLSPIKTIKQADRGGSGVSHLASEASPKLPPVTIYGGSKAGIMEPPNRLVELLALDRDDNQTLKVISITGCAGVGKTTVARTLFHNHGGKFQCRAFVIVSRNPDMRGFLTNMISQLKAPLPSGFPDVADLIDVVSKHLQGKRYFIVVDDLWTTSVWDITSSAFPRGDHSCRIITTTQIDDVAKACCTYDSDYIYKMKPLNDSDSRKLFAGRLVGSKDGCPTDIKEVPYEIIRKCCGLPLAIVNMASLFARESNILMEKLEQIRDPLSSTSEGMKDLLSLIYHSLPPRLRTCLLYLSMYAQGYVIKKDELVKQWVAEGFLSAVGGREIEEIAEGYFNELVSRGMVQAVNTNNNGEVLSCTVHQMVLDFIRHKSMDKNFVATVDYFQSTLVLPDKVRRLSVQFGGVKSAYIPENIITSQVRSFIFWGFFKCVPCFTDVRLLRLLILHIWADRDKKSFDLTTIGKLFQLKYLKIECNIPVKLPGKIRRLQHLETLQVDARLCAIPSDIVLLQRMLYLSLPSEADLPSGIRAMTSLRTLGYFDLSKNSAGNVIGLHVLINLRDLHLTCANLHTDNLENNIIWLGLILWKLMSLKCLTLAPTVSYHVNTRNDGGASGMGISLDGFSIISPPPALQRLELSRHCCIFSRLPKWIGDLVNLCILKIAVRQLLSKDIDVLKGLPAVTALTLYIKTAPAERVVINKDGFRVLTYFKFMCPEPCLSYMSPAPYLVFLPGAMPKVKKLKLGFCLNEYMLYNFTIVGFRNLAGLTEASVKFGVWRTEKFDIKAVEFALEAAVSNPPDTPTIRVQCVDVNFWAEGDKNISTEEKEENIRERSEEHVNKQDESRYARTGPVFMKHHAPTVNLVTGTLDSLLPKLLDLLNDEYTLQTGVKNNVDTLYKDLEALQAALREVAKLEQDEVLNTWARDVRDLSYDAEDIIDSLAVHAEGSDPETKLNDDIDILILRTSMLLTRGKVWHDISGAINDSMGKIQDLATRHERYKIGIHIAANPNVAAGFGPPLSAVYKYPEAMVAIKVSRDTVIKMLTDGTGDVIKKLKIVSIVGMAGLGKTTLAKAVYDNIRVQFDCTAFILVTRHPDMRKVLMEILYEIQKQNCTNRSLSKFDERQLIDEVSRLLASKRYLIVFDGIWDANLCEVIKFALIDNGLGSRVITTSRILEVTVNTDYVYKPKALSPSQSEELFNTRLFAGKDNVPCVAPKLPEKLLQKCGGVPLAIITMASLLAGKPMDNLSKVYKNIGFGSRDGGNTDVDNTRNILSCSYYGLPHHLRACLLHLHIFPVNCVIKKETLIWKWAAEGLIVERPGIRLFELGEVYFQELINKNMVIPVEDDSHPGKVIGCRVHDLVCDMICYLSTQENFVTVWDGGNKTTPVGSNARRLAVHKCAMEQSDLLANICPERLRSFNTIVCRFSTELSLSRFKLLRVIAIEECTFRGCSYHLNYLGRSLQLRYLGLYKTPIGGLPEDIGDLIYLQTMDLRGTGVKELPGGVARLRQLKCLRADKYTAVPDWMGNLTSFEELRLGDVSKSENFTTELGKLTELRELQIWIEDLDESQKETLVQSMRKLKKIQVLRLMGSWLSPWSKLNWGDDFDPPRELRELHLSIASPRLPAWISVSSVAMLSYLSVFVKVVEDQDLDILGALPQLITLELLTLSDVFLSIKGGDAFPRLRFFNMFTPFRFLPRAMPRLETLRVQKFVPSMKDGNVNFDNYFVASTLRNLVSLQKVEVEITSTGDIEAMSEAAKRGVNQHPNSPSLHVIRTNDTYTFKVGNKR